MKFSAFKINSQPESRNFTYVFRPIYSISRVLGLLPFGIRYDIHGAAQVAHIGPFDALWFLLTIGIYLTAAYRAYEQISISQDTSRGQLLNFGFYVILIAGLIFAALIIALDAFNRQKFVDILQKVTIFDNEVSHFDTLLRVS